MAALLVGDRTGQRHDDRAETGRGELGDRQRAAAADDEVGPRVARRHVVDERRRTRPSRRAFAYAARSASMCRSPAWWTTSGRRSTGDLRERRRHRVVQRLRAEAAADDEQAQRSRAPGEARCGRRAAPRCRRAADCRPRSACFACAAAQRVRESRAGRDRRRARGCGWRGRRRRSRRAATSGLPLATPISAPGNDAKPPKPSTTSGRRRRMTRRLSTHAASSANGPSTQRAHALAAHAAKRHALEVDAVRGHEPRLHAVARAEPEHAQPRATSFAATARPGNTWPPVPPVVIITVAVMACTALIRRSPAAACRFS